MMPEHFSFAGFSAGKTFRRVTLTVLLVLFLVNNPTIGRANPPVPHTPKAPPRLPALSPSERAETPALVPAQAFSVQAASLPPLKAVVFVGPIDGDNGSDTLNEIKNVQMVANTLRSHGVNVQEFYPNQANGTWANIKAAAVGAHFIVYRGHGVYWGDMPNPPVGGFALKDTFVSNDQIRSELKPAQNAIIMLSGCFTAGSAGNDTASISLDEARRRVSEYSHPFLDIGAGGYFADWWGDSFSAYVDSLFAGLTQRQAYENFYDYDPGQMWRGVHNSHTDTPMYLGWDNWYDPLPQYNNAFVGQPDKTLVDLFGHANDMVLESNSYLSLLQKDWSAETVHLAITSPNPQASFTWQATVSNPPAWFTLLAPTSGTPGQTVNFKVDPSKATTGGSVTIHVATTTAGVGNPSQDIQVTLFLADHVTRTYLPGIGH